MFLVGPAFAEDQVSNVTQTFFDAAGGSGGLEYYRFECPEDAFMVGLSGRAGEYVDGVTITCKHLNRVRWELEQMTNVMKIAPQGFRNNLLAGQSIGGTYANGECAEHTVAYAFDFYFLRSESHYLDWAIGYCAKLKTDTQDNEFYFPLNDSGDEQPHSLQECPPGEWAVGIHGHDGMFVDSIGLICRPFGDRIYIEEKVVTQYKSGGGAPLALPWLTK